MTTNSTTQSSIASLVEFGTTRPWAGEAGINFRTKISTLILAFFQIFDISVDFTYIFTSQAKIEIEIN